MAEINDRIEIPELVGQRIHHRKKEYGLGTVERAWLGTDEKIDINVLFDNHCENPGFDLLLCMKLRIISFEDSSFTLDRVEKIIGEHRKPPEDKMEQLFKKTNDEIDWESIDFVFDEHKSPEPEIELTPEQEQAEKEAIYKYLTEERGVQYLVHFTPVDNLQSILEHGILSRDELERLGITAVTPDQVRWDYRLDYSSFSISFPNYRIFYSKRSNTDHKYAVLLIDPDIILKLPYSSVSYLPENAASSKVWDIRKYRGLQSAKDLFKDEVNYLGNTIKRSELGIPDHFTTNPQAEVFIGGAVPAKHIKYILVESEHDYHELERTLAVPEGEALPLIAIGVSFFSARKDYSFWSPKKTILQSIGE